METTGIVVFILTVLWNSVKYKNQKQRLLIYFTFKTAYVQQLF